MPAGQPSSRLQCERDLLQARVPADARAEPLGLTKQESKIHFGPRGKWGTAGKLARPWDVAENVPRDVLVSKAEQPRHRVVLHARGSPP
jgi:hypothetical protein